MSLGSLFRYSWTLSFKQFLLMVLHFALELGQNFDKRFNPDLPNLKTLLVKEKSCFALYISIISPLARRSASVVSPRISNLSEYGSNPIPFYHLSKLLLNPFNPQYYGPVPMFMNWVPQLNAVFKLRAN